MLNTPNHDFKVLGCALKATDWDKGIYIDLQTEPNDIAKLESIIDCYDVLVAHNAQYDFGILLAMGVSLKDKLLFDTKIMSILHYNALQSHSLDNLGKTYFKEKKEKKQLADAVWNSGLYPWTKKELKEKEKVEKTPENQFFDIAPGFQCGITYNRQRPPEAKLQEFAIKNMDLLQYKCPEIVASYAVQDVVLTEKLFKFFYEKHPEVDWVLYSDLIKCCLKMRMNGIQIDLDKVREGHAALIKPKFDALERCTELAGKEFNVASSVQVSNILIKRGIKLPKTKKGGDSTAGDVLNTFDDDLCRAIVEARKLIRLDNTSVQGLMDIQQWTLGLPPEEVSKQRTGVIYPEMNIMGASATGRFSASSPNIQNVPAREEKFGEMCRKFFIPPKGKLWYSLDFSSQEDRIRLDLADRLGLESAKEMVQKIKDDPYFDIHEMAAKLIGVDRKLAKTINHSLGNGMGNQTLAEKLTMTVESAKLIRDKYDLKVPFLKELLTWGKNELKNKGFITTVGGTKLWDEPHIFKDGKELNYEFKGLGKYVQGSAGVQTTKAMVYAYRLGMELVCAVHDEINIVSEDDKDAIKLKRIMETCIESTIPHVSEITKGKSWGQCKYG